MRRTVLCLLFLWTAMTILADERIYLFDSRIQVMTDGNMKIRETIQVRAEGNRIRRGIFREFPTDYTDRFGNRFRVRFDVISVTRDGETIPWSVKREGNGWRIYMGSMSQTLSPGVYQYELTYITDRQIGFYEDHDELYWNVTGLDWAFPIERVTVTVELPQAARDRIGPLQFYTGVYGERGRDAVSSVSQSGIVSFATTRTLKPGEGLTIVVGWPKGVVTEPTREERTRMLLQDNRNLVYGGAGLLILLFYYMVAWVMVGRDPRPGPINPLYEPPDGLSPAGMRYIREMGFDRKAMTAAILNMAVNGAIRIEEADGDYTLIRKTDDPKQLQPEERVLFNKLLKGRSAIELDRANGKRIHRALTAFQESLKRQFGKRHFILNRGWFGVGILITIASVVLMLLHSAMLPQGAFMALWLSIWSLGVAALAASVFSKWKAVAVNGLIHMPGALFLTLFSLPFFAGEAFGIFMLGQAVSYTAVAILVALIMLNVVFFILLKAPTVFGRQLMDRIAGFRLFLSVSEKDFMDFKHPVDKTPETFERYLPHALALDVETRWAERFADVVGATPTGEESSYHPSWYSGAWHTGGLTGFTSSLSGSFSNAVSSSANPPGSSSGSGGGGFSGGGGGGGGGGGF